MPFHITHCQECGNLIQFQTSRISITSQIQICACIPSIRCQFLSHPFSYVLEDVYKKPFPCPVAWGRKRQSQSATTMTLNRSQAGAICSTGSFPALAGSRFTNAIDASLWASCLGILGDCERCCPTTLDIASHCTTDRTVIVPMQHHWGLTAGFPSWSSWISRKLERNYQSLPTSCPMRAVEFPWISQHIGFNETSRKMDWNSAEMLDSNVEMLDSNVNASQTSFYCLCL